MSMAATPPELPHPELPYPKLPLWQAIGLAYSTFFSRFEDVLRASWLWLIAVAALTGYASWQRWSLAMAVIGQVQPELFPSMTQLRQTTALLQLGAALAILAAVSIAVAWHRLMILDEQPGLSGSNITSGDLWHFVVIGFLLCVILIGPALIVILGGFYLTVPATFGPNTVGPIAFIPLLLPAAAFYVIGLAVTLRLSLLLPARAIGNEDLSFGQAWHRTSGNTWRLFWGLIVTTLPPLLLTDLVVIALLDLAYPTLTATRIAAASMASTICSLLLLPISIGFLSQAYRHFFEHPLQQTA
ncbi:hypothetical protein H8A99_08330 [Bradyrhizobium sp. Arg68]|uniref:hypothetical protein n=1 Tax=Bradyrhizobium ivorense TaxID=2511166 RepID=UPI001E419285|nr:hypothetical protein [Bradyrhizobium ivorense]MCC8936506.1 hypothetical protein [Bradyrhizobium ivorense]